jgi:hypothetical protein
MVLQIMGNKKRTKDALLQSLLTTYKTTFASISDIIVNGCISGEISLGDKSKTVALVLYARYLKWIGILAGCISDNPTATWGGLLGFLLGKEDIDRAFDKSDFSDIYWISRTRRNFPDHTLDMDGGETFSFMEEGSMVFTT